ncbi:hypothetical protein D3C73_796070 [compost metagenome]
MRIGTFLLGGIAGAAAVIYLNRKSNSMLLSAFSSSSDSMNQVASNAKENWSEAVQSAKSSATSASTSSSKAKSATGANKTDHLNQVQKYVKEDPSLKQTVNEILAGNQDKTHTIQ